jgi:hypothetical protein
MQWNRHSLVAELALMDELHGDEPSYSPPHLNRALSSGAPSADGKKLLFATAGPR